MIIKILIYLSLSTIVVLYAKIITGPPPIFQTLTQLYAHISDILKNEESTEVIVGSDGYFSADIVSSFIRNLSPHSLIVVNHRNVKTVSHLIRKPKRIFVFVDSVDEIQERLKYSDTYTFWNVRAYMFFTISYPVKDRSWLDSVLKDIWKNNILNFFVFYYFEGLEAITYNPFFEKIINLTSPHERRDVFASKLRDMNGYQLFIGFFANPPRIVEKNYEFYGVDYMILKGLVGQLNATFKPIRAISNNIEERFAQHTYDVINGNSDFGLVSCFALTIPDELWNLTWSYPRRMDDIVVLLPYASTVPEFYYVFMIFGKKVWLLLFTSYLTVVIYKFLTLKYVMKQDVSSSGLLLEAWGTMFGNTSVVSNRSLRSLNISHMLWLFSCTVMGVLFQSLLVSNLITPKYLANLDTLEELRSKNITILMNGYVQKAVTEQYPQELLTVEWEDEILRKVTNGDRNSAYALQMSVAELVAASAISTDGHPVYHIIREHLVPGYSTYLFPRNSPYLDEANTYVCSSC